MTEGFGVSLTTGIVLGSGAWGGVLLLLWIA